MSEKQSFKTEMIKSSVGMIILLLCIIAWRLPDIILAIKS